MRNGKLTVALAAMLISCGGAGEEGTPDADEHPVLDLRVVVRPEGHGGHEVVRRIACARIGPAATTARCRALGGLEPSDLQPVPAGTFCTQIYGGPATAAVTGQLRGKRLSASFKLTNGCEIARWRRNAELLGPPPWPG